MPLLPHHALHRIGSALLSALLLFAAGCGPSASPDTLADRSSWEFQEPGDPTDPSDPTAPANPGDPDDPTDPGDPTDPTDPGDPGDPTDPTGRYLQPLPDGFEVPLLDEDFVVRLEWEHLTDERPLVSRSVDLELITCIAPPGQTFDRHHTEACASWSNPISQWRIDGEAYPVRAGEDATRDGVAEQVGHALLPAGRTHVGVRYHYGGYDARATLAMYLEGRRIWEDTRILTERDQTWYAAIFAWSADPDIPQNPTRIEPPPCTSEAPGACADEGVYAEEVLLDGAEIDAD